MYMYVHIRHVKGEGRLVEFDCITWNLQNKWKIRLQLTKPVTWPPLVWGVVCGAAASGTLLNTDLIIH